MHGLQCIMYLDEIMLLNEEISQFHIHAFVLNDLNDLFKIIILIHHLSRLITRQFSFHDHES